MRERNRMMPSKTEDHLKRVVVWMAQRDQMSKQR
jgi:hypothetical protein